MPAGFNALQVDFGIRDLGQRPIVWHCLHASAALTFSGLEGMVWEAALDDLKQTINCRISRQ